MAEFHFDTPEPTELFVEIGSGNVRVDATETTTTDIAITGSQADEVRVESTGQGFSIIGPREGLNLFGTRSRLDVRVALPTGSRLITRLGSADLVVTGTIGSTRIKSGSGDVRLEVLAEAGLVETGSGDITINEIGGHLKLKSGSGDVTLGSARAEVSISTGSGDIAIEESAAPSVVKTGSGDLAITTAHAGASFTTGSGDLRIRDAAGGRIISKGASGTVAIGVRAGVPVWTDISTVSGRIKSTLRGAGRPEEGQDHVEVRTTTVSGDVVLTEI